MKKIILIAASAVILFAAGGWLVKSVAAAPQEVATTQSTLSTPTTVSSFGYSMMGRIGGGPGGCRGGYYGTTATTPSYEWLYLHLDAEERLLVDTRQAELLATYDFSSMDAAARLAALADIRTALADFIVEGGYLEGVNP